MKPNTRLDSIVFQLTPTRTRCDIVITANGKTEKIASGLLNPFLAHLKAAQEQIGKGGYSIVLEPNQGSDSTWFTKGTVERFVRFVSTPEILERVYTIESEIIQIEKAISIQVNNETGVHSVEDLPAKSEESIEGSKPSPGGNEEKAIVLYQPVSHQQEEDGSIMQEKNSKVQLVRVLQTRKTVLQKEQGMAFARAVAASFDIDNISALLSFAECFGASRMMDACKRFVDLWKAKHENGQWVEVETTEAMTCRSNLPSMNSSDIMFVSSNEQGNVASEKNGISCATGGDLKPQADHHGQTNSQEYVPGQFPHPMFPPWQMHPQANGLPVFQPYPMQGMPYFQNYPGNGPYFQPPYPPYDDSTLHAGHRTRQRRHSMDSKDLSADSDTQEIDVDMGEEDSVSMKPRKKGSKSSRKQSKTVVIRNINYIASANQACSDGDPESCSDSGIDDDGVRKSKKKGVCSKSNKEERLSGQVGDDGHWQAFQNFLLKDADESSNSARNNMFEMEGKVKGRKRESAVGNASSILGGRNLGENHDVGFSECHDIAGDMTRIRKPIDDQMYMINRQEKLTDVWDSSLDPIIANGIRGSLNENEGSSHGITDDSFMILQRSGSLDQVANNGRTTMEMDYELPSQKPENHTVGTRSQSNYEPHDLNLIPDRVIEDGPSSYDPALDYEMQAQVKEGDNLSGKKKKEVTREAQGRPKKGVKDQKMKTDRRITTGTRREKPSKLSPLEDARARAERIRAFKADQQKIKKEKEEEQKRRLEALKMERQKRIAARSGTNPAQSPLQSPQTRKQLPKLSPVSQKGSKFSDTEPGSSSPLQRSTLKTISKVHSDPKASKSGRLNNGSYVSGNRISRSASSLSVRKEEDNLTTPESKATMARIRRLSEPKSTVHISSGKNRSAEAVSRPEMKKTMANSTPDKTKFVTSKGSSFSTQKKSTTFSMISSAPVSANLSRGNAKSSSNPTRKNAKISSRSEGDESTVVEKTVVILECEKPSLPISHASDDKRSVQNTESGAYNPRGKSEEDVAIPSPASPIIVKEVDQEPSGGQVKGQSETHSNETAAYTEKVLQNVADSDTTEKPYQAPYARVSSIEDPCMIKSDYGKAPPPGLEMAATSTETTTVHVSVGPRQDLVKVSEVAPGKHEKESSKGFRRLLKFGKKNSAASESNMESDKASLDISVADNNALNGSPSEVFTLKNLLTHEESSSASTTPKKSSRSFSLLSPFRSKNSEKKKST